MNTIETWERQKERSYRMLRKTSAIAAAVILIILLSLDAFYRFASWQFNLTIAGLAVIFLILSRIDLLLHRMLLSIRHRKETH